MASQENAELSAVWATNAFFEKVIQQIDGNQNKLICVRGFTLSIATNKGDNYASVMYRALVDFSDTERVKQISLIVKVMPSGEIRRKVMVKNRIYSREMSVYTEVLEEVRKLLTSIGDQTEISPKCLYTTIDPIELLVFEDLKEQGYEMVDRRFGVDVTHSLMVFEKIAKLHACSAVLYENNASIMEPYLEGSICSNPDRQDFLIFYKYNVRALRDEVNEWEGYEDIAEKLVKLTDTIIPKGVELYKRDDSVFNVFNNNDLWTNNIMFKYDNTNERQLQDIRLFDYQLSYWGSPGIDLNYILYAIVRDDIRRSHGKFLIRQYHNVLVDILERLKFKGKIPSLIDIHVELVRKSFQAVNAAICLRPLAMMEKSESADMEIFLHDSPQGNAFRKHVFGNPRYKKFIQTMLREFDWMGFYD